MVYIIALAFSFVKGTVFAIVREWGSHWYTASLLVEGDVVLTYTPVPTEIESTAAAGVAIGVICKD